MLLETMASRLASPCIAKGVSGDWLVIGGRIYTFTIHHSLLTTHAVLVASGISPVSLACAVIQRHHLEGGQAMSRRTHRALSICAATLAVSVATLVSRS